MGLTFQQSFYRVPEEVYLVQFLEPGDTASAKDVYAIVEKPEDPDKDLELNIFFESNGYCLQSCNFDELILQGYDLFSELGIDRNDRRKQFDIY